jgi:glycerol-1-phosphate dehydrogenase [NAD(P)+]
VKKTQLVDPDAYGALCSCGKPHRVYAMQLIEGDLAYETLAGDCKDPAAGKPVFLLDDTNTHTAAGRNISKLFDKSNIRYQRLELPGHVHANLEVVEQALQAAAGYRLIIAVGAGTINDIGKYAASRMGIPYWTVPTAPSMNGYTSAIAAIEAQGVKRTLPATPPERIYADPQVIQNAPGRLRQSGFCDILAKSVSDLDWQCESLLFNGTHCTLPEALVSATEASYIDNPEKIDSGDPEAIMGLFRGLLVSGVSMSLAGSSAPASGGEHLVSHFLDMRKKITGRKPDLHGLQVAAGIIVAAVCYRLLSQVEPHMLKANARKVLDSDVQRIAGVWGEDAPEIEKQFKGKAKRLEAFDTLLPDNWNALKTIFAGSRSPEHYAQLMRRTGYPLTLKALNVSPSEFLLAVETSRTIRDRITVLDLAAHAGVLEDAAQKALALLT